MTISDDDAARHAAFLVRLMRSSEPLGGAHTIMKDVRSADWPKVMGLFVELTWARENKEVPERGARLQDWLAHLRDEP